MIQIIRENQEFTLTRDNRIDRFRRETDDPSPMFACERIRVTHLACNMLPDMTPYTFGTEPEWFTQRGIKAND